jgi:hypothetical protein
MSGTRRVLKHVFVAAFLGATAVAVYGCSGLPSSEAKDRCQAEQAGRANCFDDKSYADCLTCFEDCGDSCVASPGCPTRYSCDDQSQTPE